MIIDKLKEIIRLSDYKIKLNDLEYTVKRENTLMSLNTVYLLFF